MTDNALATIHNVVTDARTEATRADQKATTLLALVGVGLTAVLTLTQRALPTPALAFVWAAAVPLAYAVVRLLLCIRPRLTRDTVPGTWIDAAVAGPSSLYDAATSQPGDDDTSLRQRCLDAARIAALAYTKHREVRHAVTGVLLAIALLAVAVVLNTAL